MIVEAKFLREDLPYFAELLSEVISHTKYTRKYRINAPNGSYF
jgi:hypothetical protein